MGGAPEGGETSDAGSSGTEDGGAGGAGGQSSEATIGEKGGTVMGGGASVTIPPGALSSEETIVVAESEPPAALPSGYIARSPIYSFTPHGLAFSTEVSLELEYTGNADTVLRLADDEDTTWEAVSAATFASGVASVSTASFSYYVVAQTAASTGAVVALYPNAANWNDHVRNDGADAFSATGVACDNQWWNTPQLKYGECIHAGEHRAVAVTERDSCEGLSATDSLEAFEWTCEVLNGTVTFVSSGFRPAAGLTTLLDFTGGAWKPMSVTVSEGTEAVLTTPEEVWWTNPIEIDNDGMNTSTAGTIYLVTEDSAEPYSLDGERSALVVAPGQALVQPSIPPSNGRVELRGYGSWFEGEIVGTGTTGIRLTASQSTLRNVRVSGFEIGINSPSRMRLENIAVTCREDGSGTGIVAGSGHLIRGVRAGRCTSGLSFSSSVRLNVVEGVIASGGDVNVLGSNHVVADITTHHSSGNGINIGLGNGALLMHLTTAHNLQHGLFSYNISGAVPRQVIGLLSTENRMAGIHLDYDAVFRDVGTFANTHWGVYFNELGSSGNVFNGAFTVGFNGDMVNNYYMADESGCYNAAYTAPGDCANSRATSAAGSPNGLLSLPDGSCDYDTNSDVTSPFNSPHRGTDHPFPVRIKTNDPANPSDSPDGSSAHADVANWVDFENPYRGWGAEGVASPSCSSQGPCSATSEGTAGCQIYDYRLRYDAAAFIADDVPYPTGDAVLTHVFAAAGSSDGLTEALCQSWFVDAEYDAATQRCTVTFLANARELMGDLRGNENLLCESNEVCVFTPNIASYQGEGALVRPEGFTFQNGIISDVTLLAYETNGTSMLHSP